MTNPDGITIDIGAGDGAICNELYALSHGGVYLSVDPAFGEHDHRHLDEMLGSTGVVHVRADAHAFLNKLKQSRILTDFCILKECVHLVVNEADGVSMLQKVHDTMKSNGVVVVISRPKQPTVPLFKEAMETFEESSKSLDLILDELKHANFHDIDVSDFLVPRQFNYEEWAGLLRNRMWSNLANMSDAQIEKGLEELDPKMTGFEDHFMLVIARKT
eukprot:GHVO01049363.1.p1 GENE.GHVO01049363.1~~GHVO01049363.1.p1  ORF type:complete len:217 (-),score=28.90 GHVO01049363.1:154-804(-)